MAATVTLNSTVQPILDVTKAAQLVRGSIALTGSYGSGGDTLSFAGYPVQSVQAPVFVIITEAPSASVAPSGYVFTYQPGTTPANGKIRITQSSSTEFSAGAYSAALLAANLVFLAIFPLGM